jgi:hypothetical protein
MLQTQLGDRLASLLLVARVYGDRRSGGDASLALAARSLAFTLGAVGCLFHLSNLLVFVRQLFDTGVGHLERRCR